LHNKQLHLKDSYHHLKNRFLPQENDIFRINSQLSCESYTHSYFPDRRQEDKAEAAEYGAPGQSDLSNGAAGALTS
jgi:hypothetical protein